MSIIGVHISASIHEGTHPGPRPDCVMCDMRAGDWNAAVAKVNATQAAYRRRKSVCRDR